MTFSTFNQKNSTNRPTLFRLGGRNILLRRKYKLHLSWRNPLDSLGTCRLQCFLCKSCTPLSLGGIHPGRSMSKASIGPSRASERSRARTFRTRGHGSSLGSRTVQLTWLAVAHHRSVGPPQLTCGHPLSCVKERPPVKKINFKSALNKSSILTFSIHPIQRNCHG